MLLDHCLQDWNAIHWQQVHRKVSQLRQRIFRASVKGDLKKVRNLQRLMMRWTANRLLAIRQVPQCHQGKRTAGIDGYTAVTHQERLVLYKALSTYRPQHVRPVKRVYLPKAGRKAKLRPLGLPTIGDRCQQTVVKAALEPYWEAQFEATSYGFRPGRSTHEAISRVFNTVKGAGKRSWILQLDIEGAFDHIDQNPLMKSLGNFPGRAWLKSWLASGVMEQGKYTPTVTGTPQGGAISPLLLNIALHGLEEQLGVVYNKNGHTETKSPYVIVRYADDCVVMAKSRNNCQQAIEQLPAWLKTRGLRLSAQKTRICHIEQGIDFLGVNIKRRKRAGKKCGQTLLITPSKEAQEHFRQELRETWRQAGKHAVVRRAHRTQSENTGMG